MRIEASPSEFMASLEHMVSPTKAAETLDSVLQLTTQVVNGLNHAMKSGKDSVLWALLIELCSISGILFHLQQLVRDEMSKHEWMATVTTLCAPFGPLEQFKANLELLASIVRSEHKLERYSRSIVAGLRICQFCRGQDCHRETEDNLYCCPAERFSVSISC